MVLCVIFFAKSGFGQALPKYAPGSLIVKFTTQAVGSSDFRIREEKGIVVTGLFSLDSLNTQFKAASFKPFYFELFDPVEDIKQGKDRLFVIQFPADADMEYISHIYLNDSNVDEAYPNYLYYVEVIPNDPYYSTQWALPKISAPSAWDVHKGSSSVKVGIIDTGVDLDHPDLQSKLTSTSERRDEVDINTSSYIAQGYQLYPDEDYYTIPDNDPQDRHGHGSHVAGISAAATNNSTGIAGVAWNCKIMPLRAGFKIFHPSYGMLGLLEADDWGRVLDWARNNGTV